MISKVWLPRSAVLFDVALRARAAIHREHGRKVPTDRSPVKARVASPLGEPLVRGASGPWATLTSDCAHARAC